MDGKKYISAVEQIEGIFSDWMWASGNHVEPFDIADQKMRPNHVAKQFNDWLVAYQPAPGSESIQKR